MTQISKEERARVLVQALPFIKRYTGKTIVVKYGGNAMINEELKEQVMEDIVLLSLIGMKVMSKENFLIGTIDSIQVDLDNWAVVSMKVKLDKVAYAPLEIKKGLLSKKVSGLMMTDVAEIGENIQLSLDILTIKAQVTVD